MNNNFEILKQMQRNKAGPSRYRRNEAGSSRIRCKACGANETKLMNNEQSGDIICTNCGAVQSERINKNQNVRQENGKVLYAAVIVLEEQKIKLLTNLFFNVLFGDLRTETAAGYNIAQIYKSMKKYRAKYVTKGNIQSAFKGLHMPTIVTCILYCTLLKENRGMPLSIITSVMNEALLKSRTETTVINLQTVHLYRTHKKYGFASFFKSHNMKCYNNPLKPSDFIMFTTNTIVRIQNKNIHKMINTIGDEIFKEYSDITSPAFIATGVIYYVANKLGSINYNIFGLKKKELNDMKNKIENSNNDKIIELLNLL